MTRFIKWTEKNDKSIIVQQSPLLYDNTPLLYSNTPLLYSNGHYCTIMSNKEKETRGGTRQGSGAKPKYNEQTRTVAFRCPLSKVDELKLIVKSKLSKWSVK